MSLSKLISPFIFKTLCLGAIVICLSNCSKKSTPAPANHEPQKGFDHTTPQGVLLVKLSAGNNRHLEREIDTYYDSFGKVVNTEEIYDIPINTYLLFDEGPTFNENYATGADATKYSPIINNTISYVRIENGVNYLYYQPDVHETPISSPNTTLKVEFTLSDDNTILVMKLPVYKPGKTTVNGVTMDYFRIIKTYTFKGLKV